MTTDDADGPSALGLRPLSARSVIASVLLGTHPPELPAAALVRLCDRFGIAAGTTRVALSRMVASGELAAVDGGYRLAGEALLLRQRAQDEARHFPAAIQAWDGTWRTAVIVSGSRSATDRTELRRAFVRARFGEWREGVWLRPANLPAPDDAGLMGGVCRWLTARPDGDPADLVGELWDLDAWAVRGRRLLAASAGALDDLAAAPPPRAADAFTAAAALLHHLRTDPLLPAALLPDGWPADDLRSRYTEHLHAIQQLISALSA